MSPDLTSERDVVESTEVYVQMPGERARGGREQIRRQMVNMIVECELKESMRETWLDD
jgi:hypothetical protein